MEKTYMKGNEEFLTLLKERPFNKERGEQLIKEIGDINQPVLDLDGYSTTYLFEAQNYNNKEAVKLLLEKGADPNFYDPDLNCESALDDLCFLWPEMAEDEAERYEIAKLFFEYGADPDLVVGESTVYDKGLWKIFNGSFEEHEVEYLISFLKILIAYGGGEGKSQYPKPQFIQEIDKERLDEYDLDFLLHEDGFHMEGRIVDPEGNHIGRF